MAGTHTDILTDIVNIEEADVDQVDGGGNTTRHDTVKRSEILAYGSAVTGAGAVAFGLAGLATAGAVYGIAAAGFGLYAAYEALRED